jgi:uncharacterized membrane protein
MKLRTRDSQLTTDRDVEGSALGWSGPLYNLPVRRRYIDLARGLAVLVMIEAHTLDAWTRPADHSSLAFRNLTVLGGFAAPLFLWLAGTALVLSAERGARRAGSRRAPALAVVRRGLEIFVLAFLFRLQAFIVSPGSPVVTLFRVDILNVMGPSIVVAGLLWGLVENRAALTLVYAASATAVAMLTPIVRSAGWVDALPIWLQWYVRPAGEFTTFTSFPWAGFLFAGGALGALIAAVRDDRSERRLQVAAAAAGTGLIGLGLYLASLPAIYQSSSFWTSSPTYFAVRVGVMMLALAVIYALSAAADRARITLGPLEKLGRSSLFVYWIHVELVYGYATWPIRHRLTLWQAAAAYAIFCTLMYGAVLARDRVVDRWRARRAAGPSARAGNEASPQAV